MKLLVISISIIIFEVSCVRKCYFCLPGSSDHCQNPVERFCNYSLTDTKEYICQTLTVLTGDTLEISKLCVDNTESNIQTCRDRNDIKNGSSCYTCNTDLCNLKASDEIPIPGNDASKLNKEALAAIVMFYLILEGHL